jgi:hypothetical protein
MPAYSTPAKIDVIRIIGKNKGRRIGGVILSDNFLLFS